MKKQWDNLRLKRTLLRVEKHIFHQISGNELITLPPSPEAKAASGTGKNNVILLLSGRIARRNAPFRRYESAISSSLSAAGMNASSYKGNKNYG